MKYLRIVAVFLSVTLLAACNTAPKTADALVQYAKEERMRSDKAVFDVGQPLAQVTAVLKERAAQCLSRQVEVNWWERGLYYHRVAALTPRLVAGQERTRLTVQYQVVDGPTEEGEPPAGGFYMMVVDAYPVDANTTRIESYYDSPGFKSAFSAIRPWVTGASQACPNLAE